MKKFLNLLLAATLASPNAFARGKIQNEDVKSLSDIQSAITITGNLSSGSACIASPSSTTGISAGLFVYDATTPANVGSGVTVLGVPGTCSAGQIQLSANAAGSATGDTLNFGGQASQLINDTKIYVTANSINSQLSSAITNGLLGGGGGSKNYLANGVVASNGSGTPNPGNGDFEKGTTTGWSLAHSAISSNVPTSVGSAGVPLASGTGLTAASGNLSQTIVSSGQIQKNYSNNYASSAASVAGDMLLSNAFYIDTEDQAKVMQIKFYYKVNSGAANINLSGTSANSFSIWAYDVTNATWIQPAGVYNLTQNSGTGYATATFQTSSSGTQYQFALINNAASTGAFSLYVDDFSVGPQIAPSGPVITDWGNQSWSPSGTWVTNTSYTGKWRRVGDSMEGYVYLTLSGAPTTASLAVNLPSGYTVDTSKLAGGSSIDGTAIGEGVVVHSSTSYPIVIAEQNSTSIRVETGAVSGSVLIGAVVNQATPVTFASGDTLAFTFKVPIIGWSSNTAMSADTDTRVVAAVAHVSSGTSVTSGSQINFDVVDLDTHSAITTGASWKYTVPVSGNYQISGLINSATTMNYIVYKNGSVYRNLGFASSSSAGSSAAIIPCVAGDVLDVRVTATGTLVASVGSTIAASNYVSIMRLSGPAVVSATETVAANITGPTSGSITAGAWATIIYASVNKDTHGAFNTSTGVYTAPVSGWYNVSASIDIIGTAVAGELEGIRIIKNGGAISGNATRQNPASSQNAGYNASITVYLNATDTVAAQRYTDRTTATYDGNLISPTFSVVRVGN